MLAVEKLEYEGKLYSDEWKALATATLDVENGLWQYLRIYDLEGREVRVILDEQSQGKKTTAWDGRDEQLMLVAAGTYIAHLETRDEQGHVRSFTGPIVVARRLERN